MPWFTTRYVPYLHINPDKPKKKNVTDTPNGDDDYYSDEVEYDNDYEAQYAPDTKGTKKKSTIQAPNQSQSKPKARMNDEYGIRRYGPVIEDDTDTKEGGDNDQDTKENDENDQYGDYSSETDDEDDQKDFKKCKLVVRYKGNSFIFLGLPKKRVPAKPWSLGDLWRLMSIMDDNDEFLISNRGSVGRLKKNRIENMKHMQLNWELYSCFNYDGLKSSRGIYFSAHRHTHQKNLYNSRQKHIKEFVNIEYPVLIKIGILPPDLKEYDFSVGVISDGRYRAKYSVIRYPSQFSDKQYTVQQMVKATSLFIDAYVSAFVPRDWRIYPWCPILNEIRRKREALRVSKHHR